MIKVSPLYKNILALNYFSFNTDKAMANRRQIAVKPIKALPSNPAMGFKLRREIIPTNKLMAAKTIATFAKFFIVSPPQMTPTYRRGNFSPALFIASADPPKSVETKAETSHPTWCVVTY